MWFGFMAAALYCFCRFPESRRYFAYAAGATLGLGILGAIVIVVSGHP